LHPVEGTAQLTGDHGVLFGWKAATVGQGLAATHAGPQTAIGKAVVGFDVIEVVRELALCDVAHDGDMRGGGLDVAMAIVSAQVAAVPGGAQQGRELAGLPAEHVNDGCEFFGEQEEPAIGGGLLIAQGLEDGVWGGAGGGYAAGRPQGVGFGEEAGDLAPAGSLRALLDFADENDEEIEAVARGPDATVRAGADEVAEGSQELKKDGGGIGLGVRRERADEETGDAMQSRGVKRRWIAVAPLAYRGELGYSLSVTVRRAYEQAYGSRAGHFRSAGSEDSCPTVASRLGPQPETETGFW
jgi:hypothetical protein